MSASLDKSPTALDPANGALPRPYLNPDGTLVIPMLADAKYHWWKRGGQKVEKTLAELAGEAR
jgi:hypothetical protein